MTEKQREKTGTAASKGKRLKIGIGLAALAGIALLSYAVTRYQREYSPNFQGEKAATLYIYENDRFERVLEQLEEQNALMRPQSFVKQAHKEGYPDNIRSGYYELPPGLGNKAALRKLSRAYQTPVRIRFNSVRSVTQLAGILAPQLMLDSAAIIRQFEDVRMLDSLGFNAQTLPAFFLPDTYEVWWNCSSEKLMQTFLKAYRSFWNDSRLAKVQANGLSPVEASTLASIVESESQAAEEWGTIAGLYMNRLRKGIPLQADPTVVFAVGDFSIRRVLNAHIGTDSPYNTYQHIGLPPGPIRIPSKAVLEAVVNAQPNSYLYMCAKEDFSGRHNFAENLAQHNRNAQRYHQALNRKKIME